MADFERGDSELSARKNYFSIRLCLKTIVHFVYLIISSIVCCFGCKIWFSITDEQAKEPILNNLRQFSPFFGTNWNYMFQTLFLFLALSHDALEWMSKQESAIATKIRYWRDVIFSGLVVPYTCFVFTMFWSLYAIDRELVFPQVYDVVVPWWFNHCVHSNILALLVVETLLQPRRVPTDRRLELIFNATVGILYAIVYYSIYYFSGRWLYNVFGIMTWWQVCLFQLLIWSSSYIFYEIQFPINRLVHGKKPEEQNADETKPQRNGECKNGEYKNGEVKEINEIREKNGIQKNTTLENGTLEYEENGSQKNGLDLKPTPFSTKSWSLKYRTSRSQFENSSL